MFGETCAVSVCFAFLAHRHVRTRKHSQHYFYIKDACGVAFIATVKPYVFVSDIHYYGVYSYENNNKAEPKEKEEENDLAVDASILFHTRIENEKERAQKRYSRWAYSTCITVQTDVWDKGVCVVSSRVELSWLTDWLTEWMWCDHIDLSLSYLADGTCFPSYDITYKCQLYENALCVCCNIYVFRELSSVRTDQLSLRSLFLVTGIQTIFQ